jgi:ATP-binding protein involved in chromosome partitioning
MAPTKKSGSRVLTEDTARTCPVPDHRKPVTYPRHKFLLVSSVGGVGKTTIALNIALVFSKKGLKIALLDLDTFGPGIHRMLGINRSFEYDSKGRITPWIFSDNLKVAAIEQGLQDRENKKGRRKPAGTPDIRRFIDNLDWGEPDYLFADTPAGAGKELRRMTRSMPDAKIIIVSAPNKISAEHAQKMIDFFRKEKIQIFGWIENMRGYLCQDCNRRLELFSTGAGNRAIFLMDAPFLGRIPINPRMKEYADAGYPYLEKYQDSEAAIAFERVAEKILKCCAAGATERNENISLRKGRKR